MKDLAHLKADCIKARDRAETYPDDKYCQFAYERCQRRVQAKELELFCDIQEPKQ